MKCELNISCNLLGIHTNSQVGIPKKHLDNNTKVNRIKKLTIQVCVQNLEELILIVEVMNAEEGHIYASLELFDRG